MKDKTEPDSPCSRIPFNSVDQAIFASGFLRANGVHASVYTEGIGPISREMDGPVSICGVLVSTKDLEHATTLLQEQYALDKEDPIWQEERAIALGKGRIIGRIIILVVMTLFGFLAYLSIERQMSYVSAGLALAFLLLFVFSLTGAEMAEMRSAKGNKALSPLRASMLTQVYETHNQEAAHRR